jgi:hypothetical protein
MNGMNTVASRLNSKKMGMIIIAMQRLHQNDLCGHLLAAVLNLVRVDQNQRRDGQPLPLSP